MLQEAADLPCPKTTHNSMAFMRSDTLPARTGRFRRAPEHGDPHAIRVPLTPSPRPQEPPRQQPAPAATDLDVRGRGRRVRRALLVADVVSLALACAAATLVVGAPDVGPVLVHVAAVALLIGVIVAFAGFAGLYSRDGVRADNATPDDLPGIFHCVTAGAF